MNALIHQKSKAKPTIRLPLLGVHIDVALSDINDLKALTRMSASWIHEAVRKGNFPRPVIRQPRCTRWRLADIRNWLIERANNGTDPKTTELLVARAKKASDTARVKRSSATARCTFEQEGPEAV